MNIHPFDKLYQWDKNIKMVVKGLENLTATVKVHFANQSSETALIVTPAAADIDTANKILRVNIPNRLLNEPETIYAFIYDSKSNGTGTVTRIRLPVIPRPEGGENYVNNPTELEDVVYTIDELNISGDVFAQNIVSRGNILADGDKPVATQEYVSSQIAASILSGCIRYEGRLSQSVVQKDPGGNPVIGGYKTFNIYYPIQRTVASALADGPSGAMFNADAGLFVLSGGTSTSSVIQYLIASNGMFMRRLLTTSSGGTTTENWEDWRQISSLVNVDSSLSVSGDAADALVTGTKISNLESLSEDGFTYINSADIDEYRRYGLGEWEMGLIDSAGQSGSSSVVCRSSLDPVTPGSVITYTGATRDNDDISLSVRFAIFYSSRPASSSTAVPASGSATRHNFIGANSVTVPAGARYVRFTIGYASGATQPVTPITPEAARAYFSATSGMPLSSFASISDAYIARGSLPGGISNMSELMDHGTYGVNARSSYGESIADFPSDYRSTGSGILRIEKVSSTTVLQTLTHLSSGSIWQRYVVAGNPNTAGDWSNITSACIKLGTRLSTSVAPHVDNDESKPYTVDGYDTINMYYPIQAAVANNVDSFPSTARFDRDASLFVLSGGTSSSTVIQYLVASNGMYMRRLIGVSDKSWEAWVQISSFIELEKARVSYFTDDNIDMSAGVTMIRLSDTEMKIYGTSTAGRWWRLFNGEHDPTYSYTKSAGVFSPDTYTFAWSTNNDIEFILRYVPTGLTNRDCNGSSYKVPNGTPITIQTPFSINVMTSGAEENPTNYGTSDDPTILTVTATIDTTVDKVARRRFEENENFIRDVPKNQGARNAYKRAMQMTRLAYVTTGKLPVPAGGSATMTTIPKGQLCHGVPYGRSDRKNNMVGLNVSVLTYMTAIHNQYSALYTEVVSSDGYSGSAYGVDYVSHQLGASYPAMGTVCSGFTSYVLGLPQSFESSKIPYLEYIGLLKKAPDQSYTGVQPMDILKREGHVAMVIDVYRDKRGVPVEIITAESAIKFTKITHYTPEVFESKLRGVLKEGEPYTIYRRTDEYAPLSSSDFYRETPFISMPNETLQKYSFPIYDKSTDKITTVDESPYVPAEIDENGTPTGELAYNEDICTFMGDHATFRDDELIVINFTKRDYDNMVITRDGETIKTVSLPSSQSRECHAIVLTTDSSQDGHFGDELNIGAKDNYYVYIAPQNGRHIPGIYTAYLTGSNIQSDATTWQVLSLPVSVSETGDHISMLDGSDITYAAYFTDGTPTPNGGLTIVRDATNENAIKISGTTTTTRWWRLFNGECAPRYSESAGAATFQPGTYTFFWSTNNGTSITLRVTPEGLTNGDCGGSEYKLSNGTPFTMDTPFTVNVMTSGTTESPTNYGTSEEPTVLTVYGINGEAATFHGNVTVTFDNTDSAKKPVSVEVCLYSGMQRLAVILSDADVRRGSYTFDLAKTAVGEGTDITGAMDYQLYLNVKYKFKDTAGFPLIRASELVGLQESYITARRSQYDPYRLSNLMHEEINDEEDEAVVYDDPV